MGILLYKDVEIAVGFVGGTWTTYTVNVTVYDNASENEWEMRALQAFQVAYPKIEDPVAFVKIYHIPEDVEEE